MNTRLCKENPCGFTRHGFLWEALHRQPSGQHLDYGAYDGSVIRILVETGCAVSAVGVEVNRKIVEENEGLMPPKASLQLIERNQPLPFNNSRFSSASLLDVIEHIADQQLVLNELYRVLQPGGRLIVTVPGKHLFSFLDTGNFKFRFPRIHRALYLIRHTAEEYDLRYLDNPDGLIGDIEREKGWHQHFSRRELQELLEGCGFQVCVFDGSGFFTRLILPFRLVSPAFLRPLWNRLLALDARLFARTNVFCLAEKPAEG
ncbi:MAG: methyltransferase domain-containing protein [Anaerolineales bacterium]|nr:methyltransferase domain-containing protein [Anaerolineales bacterium]